MTLKRKLKLRAGGKFILKVILRAIDEISESFPLETHVPSDIDLALCLSLFQLFIVLGFQIDHRTQHLVVMLAVSILQQKLLWLHGQHRSGSDLLNTSLRVLFFERFQSADLVHSDRQRVLHILRIGLLDQPVGHHALLH